MNAIGQRLAEARARARLGEGYSAAEVARLLGYQSRGTVRRWETGVSYPDPEDLNKLANLYGCTVDYLLTRSPDPQANAIIVERPDSTLRDIMAALEAHLGRVDHAPTDLLGAAPPLSLGGRRLDAELAARQWAAAAASTACFTLPADQLADALVRVAAQVTVSALRTPMANTEQSTKPAQMSQEVVGPDLNPHVHPGDVVVPTVARGETVPWREADRGSTGSADGDADQPSLGGYRATRPTGTDRRRGR